MNSKELILECIEHKANGSIPIDLGSTLVTGMHFSHIKKLRNFFNINGNPIKIIEPAQMLGDLSLELKKRLGVDTAGILPYKNIFGVKNNNWQNWKLPNEETVQFPRELIINSNENEIFTYPQGDSIVKPSGAMNADSICFDIIPRKQYADMENLSILDNLEEFNLISEDNLQHLQSEIKRVKNQNRAVIYSSHDTFLGNINYILAPYLKNPRGIRNLEDWFSALLTHQDFIEEIFERQIDIALQNLATINNQFGNDIDIILVCATDFAGENSLLFSPEIFQKLFKPYYKRINNWIHENTKWKTMKHSCGAIQELIPEFIDCGFDILNPIQYSALKMNPAELKNNFGAQIALWGNCIPTELLISGTTKKIKEHARKNCKILSRNSGYIFSLDNLPIKTPFQNILALLETVSNFKK